MTDGGWEGKVMMALEAVHAAEGVTTSKRIFCKDVSTY